MTVIFVRKPYMGEPFAATPRQCWGESAWRFRDMIISEEWLCDRGFYRADYKMVQESDRFGGVRGRRVLVGPGQRDMEWWDMVYHEARREVILGL